MKLTVLPKETFLALALALLLALKIEPLLASEVVPRTGEGTLVACGASPALVADARAS